MNFTSSFTFLPTDESILRMKMSTLNLCKKDCDDEEDFVASASSAGCPDEDDETDSSSCSPSTRRRSTRLSSRNEGKDSLLHKINRRTIMKPQRVVIPTTEKQIEAYYLNKKVVTKSTPLETIFEEPKVVKEKSIFLGNRKVNRSIKFTDGKNVTKLTIQNRRKRIREVFGKAQKFKKITMEYFLEQLTGVSPTPSGDQQDQESS